MLEHVRLSIYETELVVVKIRGMGLYDDGQAGVLTWRGTVIAFNRLRRGREMRMNLVEYNVT